MHKGLLLATAAGFVVLVGTGSVNAADKLKVGVTATLEGTYTVLGEDGMRGYELAVEAHGGKVAGKEIETIVGSTDASPDSAVRAAKKLVEQDKVDILISPLSGAEGIAIRDYSKTQPQITVMNAGSGALETTYGDPSAGVTPSPTFYRTNLDGAQWQAGLGDYAYNVKHYKKIATVGEDYAFVYTQVMGLTVEYCKAGGQITKRLWVPLGTKDFASTIRGAARRRRRHLSRPRRRRRRELPQSIPAGRRPRPSARRLDHGRPDRAVVEGQGQGSADRHDRRQRHGRRRSEPEMAGVRQSLSAAPENRLFQKCLRQPVTARHQLLQLGRRHV